MNGIATSAIIAIVGVFIQIAIIVGGVRKARRLSQAANNALDDAMHHEKLAVEILQFAKELLATTSDEERVNLVILYHHALTEINEIGDLNNRYNKQS